MPPHGYERPAQAGAPPRAGFAMRQAPAPEPDGDLPNSHPRDDSGPSGNPVSGASGRVRPVGTTVLVVSGGNVDPRLLED